MKIKTETQYNEALKFVEKFLNDPLLFGTNGPEKLTENLKAISEYEDLYYPIPKANSKVIDENGNGIIPSE